MPLKDKYQIRDNLIMNILLSIDLLDFPLEISLDALITS
jgi:hypothetical protein